jgi:biotin operon repressor
MPANVFKPSGIPSGTKLAEKLRISGGQNAIAEAIKDFRDTVEEQLKARGICCGRKDVVLSGGTGYRLAEGITVKEA